MDEFQVKDPLVEFRFLFELHNIPSALPDLPDASTYLYRLSDEVREAKLDGFTNTRNPKKSRNSHKPNGPNAAPPNGDMPQPFNDQTTVRQLSDTGYHLLQDVVVPGLTPLKPVRPFFFL